MTQQIRVRYSPSPTGNPHIGNIRTAIFNWLFARGVNGKFVVRIEDTDQTRMVGGAIENILDSLRWLGLEWDEGPDKEGEYGPYIQSQRLSLYENVAEKLIDVGKAYRCYCSPERLESLRQEQESRKQSIGYDRKCRDLGSNSSQESSTNKSVIRFAMPLGGVTIVRDIIKGNVSFANQVIDDFILIKSDGYPTYHLANVSDDHAMKITHVFRAEEWLSSTPRHIQIYETLGWNIPKFAHLPTVLAPDRSKLSKRHGATSIMQYKEMGYLPNAIINFLSLLGWSLDDKTEILSISELIDNFSVDRVSKSGAVFNIKKLMWMNGHYIRQLNTNELADVLLEFWSLYPPSSLENLPQKQYLLKIIPIIQERLRTLGDAEELTRFFFNPAIKYIPSELQQKGMDSSATKTAIKSVINEIEKIDDFNAESVESVLRLLAEKLQLKVGQLLGVVRVAITGQTVSPPLFETMEIIGPERTIESLENAYAVLTN